MGVTHTNIMFLPLRTGYRSEEPYGVLFFLIAAIIYAFNIIIDLKRK